MKSGAEPPGGPSETLERQPDIPSAAVPDTLRRHLGSDEHPPPRDVPKTQPVEDISDVERLLDDPAGLGDFPEVERERYAVGEEFARGGLGRILEAQDHRLGRTVAIKELLSKDMRAQARFIREAKITARLEHPNIVPIHEAGHWPQGPRFYAMKLVRGTTLASRLEDAVNDEERLRLVPHLIDVADAVAYAHSQGILHRDLKPSNVMVGPFGETVLIDWGLAKDLRDSESDLPSSSDGMSPSIFETSDGIVVGTPPYMPPEQARAQPLDERADVYALGAMLYHVLCGRRPYHDTHPRD
ncbi:MAG: serine/threonine-protein kinase, partial [Myxococcota bacterium]